MIWGILLWIIGILVTYAVIFAAVKDGIDRSEVGKILINKYGVKEEVVPVSDEEIEKELEDQSKE